MYRRALSPYNSRVSSYLEALERDETVSSLRREYARYRSIQAQYDDLKYEINKAERERKRLEEKNTEIQQEYMQKIQGNKRLINQLTDQIGDLKSQISKAENEVEGKQNQNQAIVQQIKGKKTEIQDAENHNVDLEKHIQGQQQTIRSLFQILAELESKKKESQQNNKKNSEAIDKKFTVFKQLQDNVKYEEVTRAQLKEQLAQLRAKRVKLQEKQMEGQQRVKELQKNLSHCTYENESLTKKTKQLEQETSKVSVESSTVKESIQDRLVNNKSHSEDLKNLETILKDSVNGLFEKHLKKQKLLLELSELAKQIENAESCVQVLDSEISHQETTHKGLISNLKKSIQNDEEAVKTLTRKAAILNMISAS